jgi:hypothetical protein
MDASNARPEPRLPKLHFRVPPEVSSVRERGH